MAAPTPARRQTTRKQAGHPAKKAPARKVAPLRAEPVDTPIGRFAELLTEVEQPEPYGVTESITIYPPTKARMGSDRVCDRPRPA
jgi:hypothetical protein